MDPFKNNSKKSSNSLYWLLKEPVLKNKSSPARWSCSAPGLSCWSRWLTKLGQCWRMLGHWCRCWGSSPLGLSTKLLSSGGGGSQMEKSFSGQVPQREWTGPRGPLSSSSSNSSARQCLLPAAGEGPGTKPSHIGIGEENHVISLRESDLQERTG